MIVASFGPHLAISGHDDGSSPGEVRFLKFWHWGGGGAGGQARHTLGTA